MSERILSRKVVKIKRKVKKNRPKCNRCLKPKSKLDFNGKPKHLLRQSQKSAASKSKADNDSVK